MSDLISVIVPVYNVQAYLEQCLDSIIQQTYTNLDILLVNDGSTDNSLAICERYAQKDSRIRLINLAENTGLSNARNSALANIKGKYVTFIDSDDFVEQDYISRMYHELIQEDADIVISDYYQFDEQSGSYLIHIFEQTREILSQTDIFNRLFDAKNDTYVVIWGKLFKTNLFSLDYQVYFPKGRVNEDQVVSHLLYIKAKKIVYISDTNYCYRKRASSITGQNLSLKHIQDDLDGFEQRAFELLLYGYSSDKLLSMYSVRFNNYKHYLESNQLVHNDIYNRLKKYTALLQSNPHLS